MLLMMKGFKIQINGRSLSVGVNDTGMSYIFLNCMDGECRISVRGVDHVAGKKYIWVEEQIKFGQHIAFEFTDIDSVSVPVKVSETKAMSIDEIKLEAYRRAKNFLKEEGIL